MAKDIDSYLRELQAALASAGADPALMQDALFDAEEYLQAEVATGSVFATVADSYGTPEEVAAAYVGVAPAQAAAGAAPPEAAWAGVAPGALTPPVAQTPPAPPALPGWAPAPPYGQTPYYGPTAPGVQAGMAAAAGAAAVATPGAWRRFFGVLVDPAAYKALVYMILSLATGITYFTLVVTGLSLAGGMLVMIIGIPLFLLFLGMVRALALFEGKLVEGLLGTRMPRRERAAPPNMSLIQRMVFWVKDGRTWASMVYMIAMLLLGVIYFTIAVTGLSAGLWLIASVGWGWFASGDFIYEGVGYHWWFPAWGIPIAVICGVIVLVGMMHLIRAIGRGHAVFAKSMLVRLAK